MVQRLTREALLSLKEQGYDILKSCSYGKNQELYWVPSSIDSFEDYMIRQAVFELDKPNLLLIDEVLDPNSKSFLGEGWIKIERRHKQTNKRKIDHER
jgi:hypothetical protein